MRRIEFIAPVEAMRGDLSGGEKNTYLGGKPAYDAVQSGILHAENYSKRYIGSRKSSNGKKFFSLRTAATVNMTANRFPMAVFGGTASLAAAIKQTVQLIAPVRDIYKALKAAGQTNKGIRGWLTECMYPMLQNKNAEVTLSATGLQSVIINNPWINGGHGTDITIPQSVLDKFADELGNE